MIDFSILNFGNEGKLENWKNKADRLMDLESEASEEKNKNDELKKILLGLNRSKI